jgi:hypothetical protein
MPAFFSLPNTFAQDAGDGQRVRLPPSVTTIWICAFILPVRDAVGCPFLSLHPLQVRFPLSKPAMGAILAPKLPGIEQIPGKNAYRWNALC